MIKEKYKLELDAIKHNAELDERVFDALEEEKIFSYKKFYRFVPVAIAAGLALFIVMFNFDNVAVNAKDLFGNFGFSIGGEDFDLGEINPVSLDYERYLNDERAEWKGANFYYNYEDFHEGLGIDLPASDVFEYNEIIISLHIEYYVGHVAAGFSYKGQSCWMNGRFIVEGYPYEGLGYGENEDTVFEVYEYGDGKKAYFVRNDNPKYYQMVYFATENYVFELKVKNTDEGRALAKEILDVIAKEG